jgi:hypothetical protein
MDRYCACARGSTIHIIHQGEKDKEEGDLNTMDQRDHRKRGDFKKQKSPLTKALYLCNIMPKN